MDRGARSQCGCGANVRDDALNLSHRSQQAVATVDAPYTPFRNGRQRPAYLVNNSLSDELQAMTTACNRVC